MGHILLILVLFLSIFPVSCSQVPEYRAEGNLAGREIMTTVDSEIAKYYLERYLNSGRSNPQYDRMMDSAHETWDKLPLDNKSLQRLSIRFSPDFATLYFVNRIFQQPSSRKAQQSFRSLLEALRLEGQGESSRREDKFKSYLMAFVPGFAYKKDPAIGADFARQRRLMDNSGFRTMLIETDETGTVETNAAIIADELIRLKKKFDKIILVSASKGGPEAALALGKLLTPQQSSHIKAWISVGGLMRGSPLADRALIWPRSWWSRVIVFFLGFPQEIIENLSTKKRTETFDQLAFPGRLLMVQYVGAPLSGQVSLDVRSRYRKLRELGPNDGLTLLTDELVPGGIVVTDVGLDHYYRDPEIDLKTFALAYMVLEILAGREAV